MAINMADKEHIAAIRRHAATLKEHAAEEEARADRLEQELGG